MKKVKLKGKMIAMISLILVFTILIVSFTSYEDTSKLLEQKIEDYLMVKADYLKEKIHGYFEKREVLLNSEGEYLEDLIENGEKKELQTYLISQLKDLKLEYGMIDIYVGYPDGTIDCGSEWIPEDSSWKANERSWYTAAEQAEGDIAYTDVYIDVDTKQPVVTVAKAMINSEGNTTGVFAIDMSLSQLDTLLSEENIGETGYPFILDKDGKFLIHPKYEYSEETSGVDTIFNISSRSLKEIGENILSGSDEIQKGTILGVEKAYYGEKIDNTNFYMVASITYEELIDGRTTMLIHTVIIAFAALIISIISLVLYIGKLLKIIKNNVIVLQELSQGNLEVDINEKDKKRSDEIGDIVRATNELKISLKQIVSGVKETADTLQLACVQLENIAEETSSTTEGIERAVDEIASGATSQADATEEAARETEVMGNNIENIARSAQELLENAEIMAQSNNVAVVTLDDLNKVNEKTKTKIETIYDQTNETNEYVLKIREAAKFITEVADETSLLSLNASIEAARAGEAGKGFSIVAEEIKKLAEQSQISAKQIEEIIYTLNENSNNAVNTMAEVNEIIKVQNENIIKTQENFERVSMGIQSSNDRIIKIAGDAKDVNQGRKIINDIICNLSGISQENAASTEETSASTTQLAATIYEIGEEVSLFRKLSQEMVESIKIFKI